MLNFKAISGGKARKQGLYRNPQFVLDSPEESYDDGIWIIFGKDYAAWFSDEGKLGTYIMDKATGDA